MFIMHKKLYLASQSVQRTRLLHDAGLSFVVIKQSADETACDWGVSLGQLTKHLAQLKMTHAIIPDGLEKDTYCWVITADSLCTSMSGDVVYGKPKDHADAIRMVKEVKAGVIAGTGFCIDKKIWDGTRWLLKDHYIGYAQAICEIDVPDNYIEDYFLNLARVSGLNYLQLAGAFSITGYGAQFLKKVNGSYTAILGLPIHEVRCGLVQLGYYK